MQETRRKFIFAGLSLSLAYITGCSTSKSLTALPGTPWDKADPDNTTSRRSSRTGDNNIVRLPDDWHKYQYNSKNTSTMNNNSGMDNTIFSGVIPRNNWATGNPVPARMNVMTPITQVTVHHDGMDPFYSSDESDTKARLDAIRKSHLGRGWGDIGYHFVIDRAGRIWQGRPLNYQGAHVKDHNEGNIGVMCVGNFDQQNPSESQLNTLDRYIKALMSSFTVPVTRVWTHQELGPTACPGNQLQGHMNVVRHNHILG